ncbi:hypothetical protein BVY02_02710 [bacterium J17]|nr:hypothetical protein BVY02_02710 [bacterium J17]
MSDAIEKRGRALEEAYFAKKNEEAIERLAQRQQEPPRPSPITGEEMEKVLLNGVVIDRCKSSGGIWLDAGEIEQLIAAHNSDDQSSDNWIAGFFRDLTGQSK